MGLGEPLAHSSLCYLREFELGEGPGNWLVGASNELNIRFVHKERFTMSGDSLIVSLFVSAVLYSESWNFLRYLYDVYF